MSIELALLRQITVKRVHFAPEFMACHVRESGAWQAMNSFRPVAKHKNGFQRDIGNLDFRR